MKARTMITIAALCTCVTAGCIAPHAGVHPYGEIRPGPMEGKNEYTFMGYRIEVYADSGGIPFRAQAYDRDNKPVTTEFIRPGELEVCTPNPVGGTKGQKPYCEPLTFMKEGTFFKTGTHTECYGYIGGRPFKYPC